MRSKDYILFGTGDYYRRYRRWFSDRNVLAVLDNDVSKQGSSIDGYPVIAPDDISKYHYDAVVILSFYVTAMKKQLVELGVSEDKIYHFYDLHELFEQEESYCSITNAKSVLLLSHDMSLGGPALALYHAAMTLKKAHYEVVYGSMIDGALRSKLEANFIPVIIDERLQVNTMRELLWTNRYDLIICNTINFHIFLSERDTRTPVIWWLHDSPFFYEGIKEGRIESISTDNMKILSVGPVPKVAMKNRKPDVDICDLIYGASNPV